MGDGVVIPCLVGDDLTVAVRVGPLAGNGDVRISVCIGIGVCIGVCIGIGIGVCISVGVCIGVGVRIQDFVGA